MKCKNCGGNLSLEDVVCSRCGTLNAHAEQHIKDMDRYNKEFEGTKANVQAVVNNHSWIMARIIVIIILLVLIVVCGLLTANSYFVESFFDGIKAEKEAEKYMAIMDEYIEEGEYYAFLSFCNERNIKTYEGTYKKYMHIRMLVTNYVYIYDNIMALISDLEYNDETYYIERIEEDLNEFYQAFDKNHYSYIGDSERELEIAREIEEQIHALLLTYMGFTGEDLDTLEELSETQRRVLLEERYQYAE